MRPCRTCQTSKAPEAFRDRRPDCRDCERKAVRDYGTANRSKRNARLQRWRRENPVAARANDKRKRLRSNYGLTVEEVEQMRQAQGGRCAICKEDRDLVIDHCHATGRVRALLCTPCNNGLGWVEGRAGSLEAIRDYLDAPCHADVLIELSNPGWEAADAR